MCSTKTRITCNSQKGKEGSIEPSHTYLPIYTVGKKKGPPPIKPVDLSKALKSSTVTAHQQNLLWILARKHDPDEQIVNSWTGFNVLSRDDIEVMPDTLGYLPTINAPATEMTTVQEILRQSVAIQSSLHLQKIAVVFDQALFAKATEIVWKDPQKFKNVLLMMGNFHTICNLMSTIGKMFGDAGLRDLAVESGVIAEGSIGRVLEGKHYNRAVRLHKLIYEALMRLAWTGFVEWISSNHAEVLPTLEDVLGNVHGLQQNICHVAHEGVLKSDSW